MDVGTVVLAVAGVLVALGLTSGLVDRSPLTAPMLAVVAGLVLGPVLGVLPTELEAGGLLLLAELALATLLFVDATGVDTDLLTIQRGVPARMVLLALPATIALGTAVGGLVLGLPLGLAFVLACLLAPTDAALGEAFVVDERAPAGLRQSLLVESGLNDGLVVPVLAVALTVVGAQDAGGPGALLLDGVTLVGLGVVVGAAVGGGVGWALRAVDWRSLDVRDRQVGTAATALAAWAGATQVGGNGFVAAFVAGILLGAVVPDVDELVEFAEDTGELLALLTFVAFGAVFAAPAVEALDVRVVAYVLLSLTLVRMAPVAASLVGRGLDARQLLTLGWFGPRGLATVVFGLEVLELAETGRLPGGERLFGIAGIAVLVSVVAHGASAGPLAGWVEGHELRDDGTVGRS